MIELRLLGGHRVLRDGVPVDEFASDKVVALLIYLVLEPGPHERGELAGLLWEALPAGRARANLRHALHNLQQQLPDLLEVDRRRVSLRADAAPEVDVWRFQRQLQQGAVNVAAALERYGGELAAGLSLRDATAFMEWLFRRRESVRLDYLTLLEQLADRAVAAQKWQEVRRLTQQQLAVEPLREAAHRRLIEVHARLEAYDEALHQYATCRERLLEELDTEPAPETAAWRQRVLRLRHRPRHNLPAPLTPFVGRATELQELTARLGTAVGHHVQLVGPGGIGKTRLALAAGEQLRPAFLDGVVFVALADLADGRRVVGRVTEVLAQEGFAGPAGSTPPNEHLRHILDGRHYLIILDNGETVADGVAELAELCAGLTSIRLLLTSRRSLALTGRWLTHAVTGLSSSHDPDQDDDALRLFAAAARRVDPGFAVSDENRDAIRRIATLTGGMPLALELAAAWTRVRSCREIAGELTSNLDLMVSRRRDVPPRQRSIRAVLDSLWRQLGEEERQLLRRLILFRAPFTTEAAEVVGLATPEQLLTLRRAGILHDAGPRWTLHPLLRQYVAEQRDGATEREARLAHSRYYAKQCAVWSARLNGPVRRAVLATIAAVEEDLYLALETARRHALTAAYANLLDALGAFFVAEGRLIAGIQWLRQEHQAAGDDDAERAARRLILLGTLAQEIGWLDQAQAYEEQALRLAHPAQPTLAARARLALGTVAYFQGDYDGVIKHAAPALDHFHTAQLPGYEIDALMLLGLCHASLSRHHGGPAGTIRRDYLEEARDYFEAARRLCMAQENQVGEARALHNLGYVHYVSNLADPDGEKLQHALSFFERSAELLRRTGHRPRRARTLNWQGIILSHLDRYEEAETCHLHALRLAGDIGAWVIVTDILHALAAWVDRDVGRLERAALLLARVATHPTTDARIRRWAEEHLAEVTAALAPERAAALRQTGASMELEALTAALLAGELTPSSLLADER